MLLALEEEDRSVLQTICVAEEKGRRLYSSPTLFFVFNISFMYRASGFGGVESASFTSAELPGLKL